ncbi:MAG TPA: hypothetical protein VKA85_02075 [Candidatus Limnocylindrales bacterium]|nr:hypothetical protein [Candidatus Limnocylindrales bacterium]
MTFGRLWMFLAVALPAFAALLANLSSVDLTYHLRAGALAVDSRAIPSADTFTFTAAGAPWVDQQWGAQVLLAAVYRAAGWTGLVVFRAALVATIFAAILAACRGQGVSRRTAAGLTLGAFVVSAVALGLRPQLIGMVLFALTLLLVVRRRDHPRWVWLVVPITLVWANVHGSFFLGPLVVGLAWLHDVEDRAPAAGTLIVAIAAAIAACVTPFGPAVWLYAAGLTTNPLVTSRITEWQSTSLRTVPGLLFYGSVLIVAVLLARRGRRASWPTLLWFALFFAIGAYAIRGVAWWPLAAAVGVAGLLAEDAGRAVVERTERPRRLNLAIAGALVLVAVALLPAWRPLDAGLGAPAGVVGNAPPGITAAVRSLARADDRLFNPQPWGSWFEFAMPSLPVAIDSRIEVFPASVWDEYEAVTSGVTGWQATLDGWRATIVVAGKEDAAFVQRLTDAGWVTRYADADGSVLVRGDRA